MPKNYLIGNWKSNTLPYEGAHLAYEIDENIEAALESYPSDAIPTVVICPPFTHLSLVEGSRFELGSQNVSAHGAGAYTGEITAEMLAELGVKYGLVGHSERRTLLGESDEIVAKKVKILLDAGIIPVLCIGETLEEREDGELWNVLSTQISEGLSLLSKEEVARVIVAYEPVWAIGTGKSATPAEAEEVHAGIRSFLTERYGKEIADSLSLLYGGSCNANNARELFAQKNIDGALVGGASLKPADFRSIHEALLEIKVV